MVKTLQLQAVLHDVVVRLDAAEKKVQANIEVVDNLVKMTNERLARHDEKAAEAETRLQLLERASEHEREAHRGA